jgi:hypothetical protein
MPDLHLRFFQPIGYIPVAPLGASRMAERLDPKRQDAGPFEPDRKGHGRHRPGFSRLRLSIRGQRQSLWR